VVVVAVVAEVVDATMIAVAAAAVGESSPHRACAVGIVGTR
jgi:hypothetical protein